MEIAQMLKHGKTTVQVGWLDAKGAFFITLRNGKNVRSATLTTPQGAQYTYVAQLEDYEVTITNCGKGQVILSITDTDELYTGAAWLFRANENYDFVLVSRIA